MFSSASILLQEPREQYTAVGYSHVTVLWDMHNTWFLFTVQIQSGDKTAANKGNDGEYVVKVWYIPRQRVLHLTAAQWVRQYQLRATTQNYKNIWSISEQPLWMLGTKQSTNYLHWLNQTVSQQMSIHPLSIAFVLLKGGLVPISVLSGKRCRVHPGQVTVYHRDESANVLICWIVAVMKPKM